MHLSALKTIILKSLDAPPQVLLSGIKLFDETIIYSEKPQYYDYINHSDDLNVLYHLGFGIPRRNIAPGDEVTIDYRLFLPKSDADCFINIENGEKVIALDNPPQESTSKLIDIIVQRNKS